MKIDDNEWLEFIAESDTYDGPLTIGELFCEMFEVTDPELIIADQDSVWQIIVNKYR